MYYDKACAKHIGIWRDTNGLKPNTGEDDVAIKTSIFIKT